MPLRRTFLPILLAAALVPMAFAPAEFTRQQTAEDRPVAVVDGARGQIDVASLRYVGTADEYDVYLARAAGGSGRLCLTLALDDIWQTTDCARDFVSIRISPTASVTAALNYRGAEVRDMISQNVWVSRK